MFKKIIIFPIRIYQIILRPLFPSSCVFHQHGKMGCSDYTIHVIKKFGPIRGIFLGMNRIIRCHPFQDEFEDPIS